MKGFEDALESTLGIGPKVRDLIVAAGQGDLGRYRTILRQLDLGSIMRDYAMVLIILSPIVAVIKAAEKRGDTESTDPGIAELERRVNAILGKQKFTNLCTAIGEGDGGIIWSTLDSFKNYKELLKLLSNNYYGIGGPSDKFMQRVICITPWTSRNETFIKTKLIPFVRDTLGIRFSTAFGQGLSHAPSTPVASGPAAAAATITTTTTTTTTTNQGAKEPPKRTTHKIDEKKIKKQVEKYLKKEWGIKQPYGGYFVYFGSPKGAKRGWKLHISPKPENIIETLEVIKSVADKYISLGDDKSLYYKIVNGYDAYVKKLMTGNQAGKFVTIYSKSDGQAFEVAEQIHQGLQSKGLTSDSCFITLKNDFKVYPGIYTRLCDYYDHCGNYTRYQPTINIRELKSHLGLYSMDIAEFKKSEAYLNYKHPFMKLSFNGVELPKEVHKINGDLKEKVINVFSFEPLTDSSQIPDGSDFECVVPLWICGDSKRSDELYAIAKVTRPGHSDFDVIFIPREFEDYVSRYGRKYSISRRSLNTLQKLLDCLQSGKETKYIKINKLDTQITKKQMCFVDDPVKFLRELREKIDGIKEDEIYIW